MSDTDESKRLAAQDLDDIETLRENSAFKRYFVRRVTGDLKTLADLVLHDAQDADKAWRAILIFRAKFEVSKMLLQDEALCRDIVGKAEVTGNT